MPWMINASMAIVECGDGELEPDSRYIVKGSRAVRVRRHDGTWSSTRPYILAPGELYPTRGEAMKAAVQIAAVRLRTAIYDETEAFIGYVERLAVNAEGSGAG